MPSNLNGTTSPCLLGIDLGTSGLKSLILTSAGKVLGLSAREYPLDSPQPGWAEQDPETWYWAACETIREAIQISRIDPDQIMAVGIAGQMHSTVCLDREGVPLRPAILWADQRSAPQVDRLYREIGKAQLGEWTGNPLAAGFMLATWRWLEEHESHTCARTAHLLLPKDYLRYRLTGEIITEPSDASSTSLFDTARRRWSAPLLERLGIPSRILPEVRPSQAVCGRITRQAAMDTGLSQGTPVIAGGSDQALQALGNGIIDPGQVSCTIGTGGQIFAPTLAPLHDPELRLHLFCHVLEDRWHYEAAMLCAGLALRWFRDLVSGGQQVSYQELADQASTINPGAEGLFFLPYLVGERTPHMDPAARGAFVGLTLRHGQAHMVRALMEGVVLGLRQGLEVMMDLGVSPDQITSSGGGTRHPLWLRLQADIFGLPILRNTNQESAATGAALLAGVEVGLYKDAAHAVRSAVSQKAEVIQPEKDAVRRYDELYQVFCSLYPALYENKRIF